jgi:chromosome segregation ATPase
LNLLLCFLLFFGKSNLIDAICFAFGENALQLRAKRLEDLVHGNVIGRSRSGHRCSVMLVFDDRAKNDSEASNAGESHVFGQAVRLREVGNTSDDSTKLYAENLYTRNGRSVTCETCTQELFRLTGVRPRSFVVAQGTVESIAVQDRRERAVVFDKMSRAAELREAYEAAYEEVRNATNLRRDLELERQTLKLVRENDAVLEETMRRYSPKQTQLALFGLFHAEKQVERVDRAVEEKRSVCVCSASAKKANFTTRKRSDTRRKQCRNVRKSPSWTLM